MPFKYTVINNHNNTVKYEWLLYIFFTSNYQVPIYFSVYYFFLNVKCNIIKEQKKKIGWVGNARLLYIKGLD